MSLFKKFQDTKLSVQGDALVRRDTRTGEVVDKALPVAGAPVRFNARAMLRQVTNGGMEQLLTLHAISQGMPWRAELPDGKQTDWIVPTTAERMQAAQTLWEYQHGKAVAQTEVLKAAEASDELAQYQAFSDEQLAEAALPYLQRINKKDEDK